MNLAIIPAKRYSSRCLNKNTRDFLGRPIVEWTIEAAKQSGCFDVILLYSNIEEWEMYTESNVLWWHNSMAKNRCTLVQVCEHILGKEVLGKFDNFCCLYVTAPMRTAADIEMAYRHMLRMGFEGVMGVTKFVQPWWQALYKNKMNMWKPESMKLFDLREEQLIEAVGLRVVGNGSMYWAKVGAFLEQKTWYLNELGVLQMPYERSIDINTEVDFELAEFFARKLLEKGGIK
ncbi:MAG: hypothetical protein ABID54_00420 [Pseudomonadota bacterium]